MSVQGLDVKVATSSGAQCGGGDELLDRMGVAGKPSLYKETKYQSECL